MAGVKKSVVEKCSRKKFNILPFASDFLLSLLSFTVDNLEEFRTNPDMKFRVFWDVAPLKLTYVSEVCTASIIRAVMMGAILLMHIVQDTGWCPRITGLDVMVNRKPEDSFLGYSTMVVSFKHTDISKVQTTSTIRVIIAIVMETTCRYVPEGYIKFIFAAVNLKSYVGKIVLIQK
jgi:hypothetical protein